MDEKEKKDRPWNGSLGITLKKRLEEAVYQGMKLFSVIRSKTDNTRNQLKEVFYSTSDQMLEKAEGTRKSVKMRMAILEIEHHLNRLYPQIGKVVCDLSADGAKSWTKDKNLKIKMDLAEEYRQRLTELKQELDAHHQRGKVEQK